MSKLSIIIASLILFLGFTLSVEAQTNPFPGVCGAAATAYQANATNFLGALCLQGTPIPANPVFPAPGGNVGWTCMGSSFAQPSDVCTALRSGVSANPSIPPTFTMTINDGTTVNLQSGADPVTFRFNYPSNTTQLQFYISNHPVYNSPVSVFTMNPAQTRWPATGTGSLNTLFGSTLTTGNYTIYGRACSSSTTCGAWANVTAIIGFVGPLAPTVPTDMAALLKLISDLMAQVQALQQMLLLQQGGPSNPATPTSQGLTMTINDGASVTLQSGADPITMKFTYPSNTNRLQFYISNHPVYNSPVSVFTMNPAQTRWPATGTGSLNTLFGSTLTTGNYTIYGRACSSSTTCGAWANVTAMIGFVGPLLSTTPALGMTINDQSAVTIQSGTDPIALRFSYPSNTAQLQFYLSNHPVYNSPNSVFTLAPAANRWPATGTGSLNTLFGSSLGSGLYTIYGRACSTATNCGAWSSVTVNIGSVGPSAPTTSPAAVQAQTAINNAEATIEMLRERVLAGQAGNLANEMLSIASSANRQLLTAREEYNAGRHQAALTIASSIQGTVADALRRLQTAQTNVNPL